MRRAFASSVRSRRLRRAQRRVDLSNLTSPDLPKTLAPFFRAGESLQIWIARQTPDETRPVGCATILPLKAHFAQKTLFW
jgi:hypothetical protein